MDCYEKEHNIQSDDVFDTGVVLPARRNTNFWNFWWLNRTAGDLEPKLKLSSATYMIRMTVLVANIVTLILIHTIRFP